jgi:5-methylcytosine-specific restriction endonuclease McrBC regulatory subunit McrC
MKIDLTDNNKPNPQKYSRKDVSALFSIAGKSITELCCEHENLLIFPNSLVDINDKIDKNVIFDIQNITDSEVVEICTGNIMGFIGLKNHQIKIRSRFDSDKNDFLLHYMLQKVLSFNLFNLNHNNEQEDVFDFIMFMFPYFLKIAMNQGVYREYQNYKHNNSNVKGAIDVRRHISKNIPFIGKIAYSTREYSCDNNMTELIRHTIEFIKTKKYGYYVLNFDRETKENIQTIIEHTPSYNKNERNKIINKNLRTKIHPYYTEYSPLRILCLQILRMEEIKYGEDNDEVCGILFDGAWLWEEYVNTILKDLGFIHPENKRGKGAIYIFEDNSGQRFPDFYKTDFVLDAKYKRLENYKKVFEVGRDDIHQIITYMTILPATKGGFICPLTEQQTHIPISTIKGTNSTISIFGIEIAKNTSSFPDFCKEMENNEEKFKKIIKNIYL